MPALNARDLFSQSESQLRATRLLLPPSPGATAFLYNEELVFACSTGSGRAAPPDERIPFNSSGGPLEQTAGFLRQCFLFWGGGHSSVRVLRR